MVPFIDFRFVFDDPFWFLFAFRLPVGMVQICCACNEKNANLAEGGASNSIDGRFTPSDNKSVANSDSSIVRFKVIKCPWSKIDQLS